MLAKWVCPGVSVVLLVAVLLLGLGWRSAERADSDYLEYARWVDSCRLLSDETQRLICFDSTITQQP